MQTLLVNLCFLICLCGSCAQTLLAEETKPGLPDAGDKSETIRVRPDTWAKPVIGSELENFYKIDDILYRCEQPDDDGMEELEAFGIKSILNFRDHHDDEGEAEDTKLKLYRVEMNAGSITYAQVIESLRIIHNAPKPVAIHCWHGSDRTGCVAAAYRVVFQGWSKADAIDELRHGGYGFHASFYGNIPRLINVLDAEEAKKAVLAPVVKKAATKSEE